MESEYYILIFGVEQSTKNKSKDTLRETYYRNLMRNLKEITSKYRM